MAYEAYDLSLFETNTAPKKAPEKAPLLRQIKNAAPQKRLRPLPLAACVLAIFTMMTIHVANNAAMTETRAMVKAQEAALESAKSKENLLDVELDKLLSLQNIEVLAEEKLGLTKPEQYQVEYLTGEKEMTIKVSEEEAEGFWGVLTGFFDKIASALGA